MTELQLQQGVLECARRLGFMAYHTADARRSEPGFPDALILGHGQLIVMEFKTQRGKVRAASLTKRGRWLPGQQEWLDAFESAGVPAYLVRPERTSDAIGYEDALAVIREAADAEGAAA